MIVKANVVTIYKYNDALRVYQIVSAAAAVDVSINTTHISGEYHDTKSVSTKYIINSSHARRQLSPATAAAENLRCSLQVGSTYIPIH